MVNRKDRYLDDLRNKRGRIKFKVGKSGTKYPYFHKDYDLNPGVEKRYSNTEGNYWKHIGCWDLPLDDYPYTIEYGPWEDRVPVWMKDYLTNEYAPKRGLNKSVGK